MINLLIRKITDIGLNKTRLNNQQAKIIRVTNLLHFVAIINLLFFGFTYFITGLWKIFYVDSIWLFLNVACLIFNYYKQFEISKNILLLSTHLYILMLSFLTNVKDNLINLLIINSLLPVFVFKTRDSIKIILFFCINLITYLIVKQNPHELQNDSINQDFSKNLMDFCAFFLTCFTLIIVIYFQKYMGEKNELRYLKEIRERKKTESALAEAKKTSEKANLIKTEFLSMISHNIRTPLNAVLGIANLMIIESPKKTQVSRLNALKNSTENLIQLTDNILDFNKMESGKMEINEVQMNVQELIDNVYANLSLKAMEKGNLVNILIDKKIPSTLFGDDLKLTQVLINIVSNAIKFTENGKVTLEVVLKNMTDETASVYFSVSDTGIGIAREKQKHIFESFTHTSSEIARKYGGSGLGLAITKKLLKILNSEIYVESSLGRGSKFYFSMEFKLIDLDERLLAVNKEPQQNKNLNGTKVLLVDDNSMNLYVAESFLKKWNAQVDTAEDGLSAVEKAKNNVYDIILMDLQMPRVNGFDASKEIRAFSPDVAILALTADSFGLAKEKIEAYGITDIIVKPFQPDELFKKLQKLSIHN